MRIWCVLEWNFNTKTWYDKLWSLPSFFANFHLAFCRFVGVSLDVTAFLLQFTIKRNSFAFDSWEDEIRFHANVVDVYCKKNVVTQRYLSFLAHTESHGLWFQKENRFCRKWFVNYNETHKWNFLTDFAMRSLI